MLKFWQKRKQRRQEAQKLARAALDSARTPLWYAGFSVPDTFDGRFEIAVLALAVGLYPLRAHGRGLIQPSFDSFFKSMELSLREMGVGDLSVPRHMKRMMSGFNGRMRHYWRAWDDRDETAFTDALRRNVYGTVPQTPFETVEKLANRIYQELDEIKTETPHDTAA